MILQYVKRQFAVCGKYAIMKLNQIFDHTQSHLLADQMHLIVQYFEVKIYVV